MEQNWENKKMTSLKPAREKLGLSLKEVAEKICTDEEYLRKLEEGKLTRPSANVIYKLSELYKIPLKDLALEAQIITKKEAKHY